jgi:exosortase/archaeosortase family protein
VQRVKRGKQPSAATPLLPSGRFLSRAALWMVVGSAVYHYPHDEHGWIARAIHAYLCWQAQGAGALLELFDGAVQVRDTLITGRFPLRIVRSCSALDVQALFAASVSAFPAPLWRRASGLLAGALALTALNVGRIAGLYWVGVQAPGSFETFHEEVFPLALIAAAVAGFAGWTRWAHHDSARA